MKEKKVLRHWPKPQISTLGIDVLVGDEEQIGKKEERTKKEMGMSLQPNHPDPSVASNDHKYQSESILLTYMGMRRRRIRFQEEGRDWRLPSFLYADDLVLCGESVEDLR